MNKERLEEIKFSAQHTSLTVNPPINQVTISEKDYDWLIEQAERAEVLDKAIDEIKRDEELLQGKYKALYQQNKRYREALEKITTRKMSMFLTQSDMNVDFIKTARKALEGED